MSGAGRPARTGPSGGPGGATLDDPEAAAADERADLEHEDEDELDAEGAR